VPFEASGLATGGWTRPLPELRIDPLSGLKTIVAGERGERPGAWLEPEERQPIDPATDPFLEGHEDQTPPEIYALRADGGPRDGPGWRVRVVPNRYPALAEVEDDGEPGSGDPLAAGRGEPELFAARPATGAHEVIVNSPQAVSSLLDLDPKQLAVAMSVWRERIRANAAAAYVHLIVNEGRDAGASLPHTHAQLYALPFVPAAVARERERFTAYAERTQGRNLLEDLLQEEVRLGERTIAIDGEAVAICPFASRVPFQLQIVPRRPAARFEDDGPLAAHLLHDALARLRAALGSLPSLNLWVRTAPAGAERFCWRIDVLPRLAHLAGLEIGTGVNLCVLPPERAAALLRDAGV
jgi:UDPglucose--hexose-1-phosphate uridylyltransferase